MKERCRPSLDRTARASAPLLTRAVVVAARANGRIAIMSSGASEWHMTLTPTRRAPSEWRDGEQVERDDGAGAPLARAV